MTAVAEVLSASNRSGRQFHPDTCRWTPYGANGGYGVRRTKAALPSGCKPHPAKCSSRK